MSGEEFKQPEQPTGEQGIRHEDLGLAKILKKPASTNEAVSGVAAAVESQTQQPRDSRAGFRRHLGTLVGRVLGKNSKGESIAQAQGRINEESQFNELRSVSPQGYEDVWPSMVDSLRGKNADPNVLRNMRNYLEGTAGIFPGTAEIIISDEELKKIFGPELISKMVEDTQKRSRGDLGESAEITGKNIEAQLRRFLSGRVQTIESKENPPQVNATALSEEKAPMQFSLVYENSKYKVQFEKGKASYFDTTLEVFSFILKKIMEGPLSALDASEADADVKAGKDLVNANNQRGEIAFRGYSDLNEVQINEYLRLVGKNARGGSKRKMSTEDFNTLRSGDVVLLAAKEKLQTKEDAAQINFGEKYFKDFIKSLIGDNSAEGLNFLYDETKKRVPVMVWNKAMLQLASAPGSKASHRTVLKGGIFFGRQRVEYTDEYKIVEKTLAEVVEFQKGKRELEKELKKSDLVVADIVDTLSDSLLINEQQFFTAVRVLGRPKSTLDKPQFSKRIPLDKNLSLKGDRRLLEEESIEALRKEIKKQKEMRAQEKKESSAFSEEENREIKTLIEQGVLDAAKVTLARRWGLQSFPLRQLTRGNEAHKAWVEIQEELNARGLTAEKLKPFGIELFQDSDPRVSSRLVYGGKSVDMSVYNHPYNPKLTVSVFSRTDKRIKDVFFVVSSADGVSKMYKNKVGGDPLIISSKLHEHMDKAGALLTA